MEKNGTKTPRDSPKLTANAASAPDMITRNDAQPYRNAGSGPNASRR